MINKKELEKQAEKLQKELDTLKNQISECDKIDLFKITTYKQVCEALNEQELKLEDFTGNDAIKTFNFARLKQI